MGLNWLNKGENMNGKQNINTAKASGGIGFIGLLTIALIVLKLANVIAWSWLWVLSPIWITVLVWVVILIVLFVWLGIIKKPKQ